MDIKFKKPLVVLDIETTGVNPSKDEIIELYMLKVINNEFIDEYDGFTSIKSISETKVEFSYKDGSKKILEF